MRTAPVPDADPAGGQQEARACARSPCRELLWALLRDLFTVRDRAKAGRRDLQGQYCRDGAWVQSPAATPFTFLWVCQHLELPPAALRQAYWYGQPVPDFRV